MQCFKSYFVLFVFSLIQLTSFGQTCLPNGVEFTLQSEINTFQKIYPGCKEILGTVKISGSSITNLDSLRITKISGGLLINYTENLKNLSGLKELNSIGLELSLRSNKALESIIGLNKLKNIGRSLSIENNAKLLELTGLNSLESINGSVSISNNASLYSIYGLSNLISIGEDFAFYRNNKMKTLDGLQKLKSIGYDFQIFDNKSLKNIDALSNVDLIDDESFIRISENDSLESILGLSGIKESVGELKIYENPLLKNLNGLNGIDQANNDLTINSNSSLEDIQGLKNLKVVNGDLNIYDNSKLNTLSGLMNLKYLVGGLFIEKNSSLLSLNGLDSIEYYSIINGQLYYLLEEVSIINNGSKLITCAVNPVCDFIIDNPSKSSIFGNGAGCNSINEVKFACNNKVFTKNNSSTIEVTFLNSNPVSEYLIIQSNIRDLNYIIYNMTGEKQIKGHFNDKIVIPCNKLPSGIYNIEFSTKYKKLNKKFVKF